MGLKEKIKVETIVWWIKGLLEPGENARKNLTGVYLGSKLKEAIMENKKWYQSKTVIFNILSGVVAIATTLASDKAIPDNVTTIFSTIVMVGNVALRFCTDRPIK